MVIIIVIFFLLFVCVSCLDVFYGAASMSDFAGTMREKPVMVVIVKVRWVTGESANERWKWSDGDEAWQWKCAENQSPSWMKFFSGYFEGNNDMAKWQERAWRRLHHLLLNFTLRMTVVCCPVIIIMNAVIVTITSTIGDINSDNDYVTPVFIAVNDSVSTLMLITLRQEHLCRCTCVAVS